MSRQKIHRGVQILREEGYETFAYQSLSYLGLWKPAWNTITSRYPVGTNVFDRDWDLLVVLDACRVDALRSVASSIDRIDDVGEIRSVGSMSAEWMLNTFTTDYADIIQNTAYISANIWSNRILRDSIHTEELEHDALSRYGVNEGFPSWGPTVSVDMFEYYEDLFNPPDQHRLHPGHSAAPHLVTDRAISVSRERDMDRLIVHYWLPHQPFIADALDWKPDERTVMELMDGLAHSRDLYEWEKSWEPGRSGDVSPATYYEGHVKNLQLVLEYVEILRDNVDANKMVISADHGESMGEHNSWGHPFAYPFGRVKKVPWVTETAVDDRSYESQYDKVIQSSSEEDQEEILKQLGYL